MKKLISLILTLAMVLTMIPVSAFAATTGADSQSVSYHLERTNPLYEDANLEDASAPSGGTYSLRSLKAVYGLCGTGRAKGSMLGLRAVILSIGDGIWH